MHWSLQINLCKIKMGFLQGTKSYAPYRAYNPSREKENKRNNHNNHNI